MTDLNELLAITFFGNTVMRWGLSLLVFLVTFTVLPLVRGYIRALRKRFTGIPHRAGLELAALLADRTRRWFLWAVAIWAAEAMLAVPRSIDLWFDRGMIVVLALQVGSWASATVGYFLRRHRSQDVTLAGALTIVQFVAGVAIWALVALVALDNLGFNVTALVAGLGIGGVAVALAVQAVLGDLLASLSITLDKPFVVGDFLVMGAEMGTVEQIGIRNTRLRSLSGEQIILSNADLLNSRIRNYGRMYERRVLFTIGVVYETAREKLERIPAILEAAVRAQEKTRFERSHFVVYGDFALQFETVYFVLDADYLVHANIQQAINFRILEEFERAGIEFAYPTRRVLVSPPSDVPGETSRPTIGR